MCQHLEYPRKTNTLKPQFNGQKEGKVKMTKINSAMANINTYIIKKEKYTHTSL